ncbi:MULTISPECIES: KaiC domain-containing protein [Halorussus]|uniref:KaiC domain-containing protein n=1 Tax=Halorussus TaxID=1070314 RepID=UPI00209F16A6|nr:KaiC domain-containing protein [Halorussus vallis]USZ77015.1 KaiC domain-containing protein [Halorussus vallis]
MSDDDWFERALREDDESAEDDERGEAESAEPADSAEEASDDEHTEPDDSDGGDGFADADAPSFDAAGETDAGDGADTGGFADADPYDADADGNDLFEEDFASAFANAPSVDVGDDSNGGGDAAFGAGAQAGFGGGFGDAGPADEDAFAAEEEFDSDIPRVDVGIEGLDNMIQGGVPERTLMTTIGSAGTGKTTFGLQFLHEALREGENAVFITLEESHDRIVNTATEKGWPFEEYVEEGRLAVIDLDPIEMANSLTSIRNDLPRLVAEFDASRLVLDSVSLLEMMYDNQATRRNEVYDFTKSLKEAGVTTMLTSEASEDNPYASRHGIIEYLVDAVFVLRYIRSTDDFRETRLAVEIQKIRDANHSREIKPYSITNEGISVYRQANIF